MNRNNKYHHLPSHHLELASCVRFSTFPTASFSYRVFLRKGFIFLILLAFAEAKKMWLCSLSSSREGRRGWRGRREQAHLGCSFWTENSLWLVARGDFLPGEWRREGYRQEGVWLPALPLLGMRPVTLSKGLYPF